MDGKEKKKSLLITSILCAILLGLSIAYAALTATLDITLGKVTQNALSWNVGFESGNATATKTGSADSTCGEATITTDSASITTTTLKTLHDKCTYKLKIKNTGGVDAAISSITAKTPTGVTCTNDIGTMTCGNINYKLTTDSAGTTLLTTNKKLSATTGELDLYLIVEYTGTSEGSSVEQNSAGFTITYSQE